MGQFTMRHPPRCGLEPWPLLKQWPGSPLTVLPSIQRVNGTLVLVTLPQVTAGLHLIRRPCVRIIRSRDKSALRQPHEFDRPLLNMSPLTITRRPQSHWQIQKICESRPFLVGPIASRRPNRLPTIGTTGLPRRRFIMLLTGLKSASFSNKGCCSGSPNRICPFLGIF